MARWRAGGATQRVPFPRDGVGFFREFPAKNALTRVPGESNERAFVASRDRKRRSKNDHVHAGDRAHGRRVSRVNDAVAYRVMRQRVRHHQMLQPASEFRLENEHAQPVSDVRWCLQLEAPIRQTSRKAGTQSYEATARIAPPSQSSRRTVHWRSTDALDATARCRRHFVLSYRLQRE